MLLNTFGVSSRSRSPAAALSSPVWRFLRLSFSHVSGMSCVQLIYVGFRSSSSVWIYFYQSLKRPAVYPNHQSPCGSLAPTSSQSDVVIKEKENKSSGFDSWTAQQDKDKAAIQTLAPKPFPGQCWICRIYDLDLHFSSDSFVHDCDDQDGNKTSACNPRSCCAVS